MIRKTVAHKIILAGIIKYNMQYKMYNISRLTGVAAGLFHGPLGPLLQK